MKASDYNSLTRTRFQGLAIARWGRNWFFVDLAGDEAAKIGETYRTRDECLADLNRFAGDRGYKFA